MSHNNGQSKLLNIFLKFVLMPLVQFDLNEVNVYISSYDMTSLFRYGCISNCVYLICFTFVCVNKVVWSSSNAGHFAFFFMIDFYWVFDNFMASSYVTFRSVKSFSPIKAKSP